MELEVHLNRSFMKVYTVVEIYYSPSEIHISRDILAVFYKKASADEWIKSKNLLLVPGKTGSAYCQIREATIASASTELHYLTTKNQLGYMGNPTVYSDRNGALVEKTLKEATLLNNNTAYRIDSDIKFRSLSIL